MSGEKLPVDEELLRFVEEKRRPVVDCKEWGVVITLRRYGLADIEIEVPFSDDADPRGSLVVDTSRYAGTVDVEEIKEAAVMYELLWKGNGATEAAKELYKALEQAVRQWLEKHVECKARG